MQTSRSRRQVWAAAAALAVLVLAGLVTPSMWAAEDVVVVEPESVGMSSTRLERIDAFIQEYIDTNQIAACFNRTAQTIFRIY